MKSSKNSKKNKEPHKELLQKSFAYVCENLNNFKALLRRLISEDVINFEEEETILAEVTQTEKTAALMRLFYRKPPEQFQVKFRRILLETSNVHVERHLREQDERSKVHHQGVDESGEEESSHETKSKAKDKAKAKAKKLTEKRKKRKKNKKKGKIYSVYKASDSDEDDDEKSDSSSSSSDESNGDDKDEDDRTEFEKEIDALVDLYYVIQTYLELLNYYPYTEFKVYRFGTDRLVPAKHASDPDGDDEADGSEVNACQAKCLSFLCKPKKEKEPKREFEEQYFQANRPIWLTKVGFYGPATISNTAYTVTLQLVKGEIPTIDVDFGTKKGSAKPKKKSSQHNAFLYTTDGVVYKTGIKGTSTEAGGLKNGKISPEEETKGTIIGQTTQIVEAPFGQIFYVPFASRPPIAIEPNTWYKLKFKIQGADVTFIQHPSSKLTTCVANCDRYGQVKFTFTIGPKNSSTQCPALCFYKGKERLLPVIFSPTKEPVSFENQLQVKDWVKYNRGYDPI